MQASRNLISRLGRVKKNLRDHLPHGISTPEPGLYHFERSWDGERSRVHLRIDPDGRGLLLVNASRVLHLNPTAAFMAYFALHETPTDQAVKALRDAFKVSPSTAQTDYTEFLEELDQLIHPDGACPIHDLNLEVAVPFSARPSAPYRMDLALTYQCNNDCSHCYNARSRNFPELDTESWKKIIDHIWDEGIPHVVFTGGEPTLRQDLPQLIAYAEQKGLITGLNTNGRRLKDDGYVSLLVDAGLDHVQITLESHSPEIHDQMVSSRGAWKQTVSGIQNVLNTRLYVMTNTTMLRENSPYLGDTLNFLSELGVPTFGLNALIHAGHGASVGTGLNEKELAPLLAMAHEHAENSGQRLIWYTPTQYCNFDPMQLELGVKGCTAALYNMCIEPDGSVLPCQSYYQSLGNFLDSPWQSIWNHPLAIHLRERRYAPEKCSSCSLFVECGGGCPLLPDTKETATEIVNLHPAI